MSEEPSQKTGRLYGRRWQVLIYKPAYTENEDGTKDRDPEHDIAMDVSRLRCVFKAQYSVDTAISLCTLTIYNMNAATEKEVIEEGFQIAIYGGYKEGQYGEIFIGDIVQVFRNREDGVDYRLEIIALKGAATLYQNFVKASVAANSLPRDVPKNLADNADTKFKVGETSDNFTAQPLPRGKVLFGTPAKYLRNLCVDQDAIFREGDDEKLEVVKVDDEIPEDRVLVLTPKTGLVGTPVYGDDGIHIKMLLDARVKLRTLIKIDNEIIRRQAMNFDPAGGSSSQMPQTLIFDKDGEYAAFSIVHSGDTYGDEWSTEIIGAGRNGRTGLMTALTGKGQTMR
ncbi:MAG: hypothetical protein ACTTJE_00545 [Schwartzia sp. (in: firmicutes)]